MHNIRKPGVTALTAAVALSIGVIPTAFMTSSILAAGEGTTTLTPATDYFPGPTLTLSTASGLGAVALGGSDLTQTFDGGQFCQLGTTSGVDLIDFGGTIGGTATALAGFRDGSIGVYEGTNASQCFRVDANSFTDFETLTLKLGSALDGFMAESAVFDIQMNTNDAKIVVQTIDSTIADPDANPPVTGVVGDDVVLLTGKEAPKGSPRIRSGDHVQLAVPKRAAFDTVTLTAVVGSFSLEGGGDGGTALPTTITLLEEADVDQFCPGAVHPEVDAIVKYVGETTGTDNEQNSWGGDCFGISLTDGATEMRFLKPLDVSPEAQFLFTKTWTYAGSQAPMVTLNGVGIDFEFLEEEDFNEMPYCPSYLYDESGILTGFTPSNPAEGTELADLAELDMVLQDNPATDAVEGIPDDPTTTTVVEGAGTQFACIGEPRTANVTADEVQITDTIYLVGDARMSIR